MSIIAFDVTSFRTQFPAFANPVCFSDALLTMYWNWATSYVSACTGGTLSTVTRTLALNLMTAHLTQQSVLIKEGENPNLVQGATIDKVNVTLTPPPLPNQWRWWLSTTAYGAQLLALLQANAVGGYFIGGAPDLAAFRRVGGVFIP